MLLRGPAKLMNNPTHAAPPKSRPSAFDLEKSWAQRVELHNKAYLSKISTSQNEKPPMYGLSSNSTKEIGPLYRKMNCLKVILLLKKKKKLTFPFVYESKNTITIQKEKLGMDNLVGYTIFAKKTF